MDSTSLLGLDTASGCLRGPKFHAANTNTIMEETGYVAALFMKECATSSWDSKIVPGRKTRPVRITIADLYSSPPPEIHPRTHSGASTPIFASIPIAASIGTCALCVFFEDWYASLAILIGIVASGISCLVLSTADLVFTHPEPTKGSPAGDGILGSDEEIVLLRGAAGAVNAITHGTFTVRFSSESQYKLTRWCPLLFLVQSIIQLFLIPQASLLGQVLFLSSLGISAWYNSQLSSLSMDQIYQKLLFERVLEYPTLTRYTLGTRTAATVFILLALRPRDPTILLNELIPNDTRVWKQWKETILEELCQGNDQAFQFRSKTGDLNMHEKDLLEILYEDAKAGYYGYKDYLLIN